MIICVLFEKMKFSEKFGLKWLKTVFLDKKTPVFCTHQKKSRRADRKEGGGGGVNAYNQPHRKIWGVFLRRPLVNI